MKESENEKVGAILFGDSNGFLKLLKIALDGGGYWECEKCHRNFANIERQYPSDNGNYPICKECRDMEDEQFLTKTRTDNEVEE